MTDIAPQRGKRPPTIHDVAAQAGVSRGTVSRVLQGGRNVSPASHRAVDAAIRKLGYVVNQAARSLVTRRAGSVAFLLSETQDRLFLDPNLATMLRGCTTALAAHDIPLVLVAAGTEAERRRIAPYLAAQVDGALLFTWDRGTPMFDLLQETELPFVCCGKPHDQNAAVSYVVADDREGARTMVRYLLETGRKRIAHIAGPADGPGGSERLEGYREMLAEHRIRFSKRLVATGDYSRASGEACMQQLLTRVPDLDAVFVASDLMAEGALAAIERAGLSVPGDIAVGGFDDSSVAAGTNPPLTTMRQPWERISEMMVRQLLAQIDGDGPASVILPTELVIRESA
ncbi:LacI family DNA-binding transcriptional regulator [Kribbella sp. NPDC023855]|uniref:LacI family DNA-binding transcriptional regulator n=1 Tax=Kribbella sp. NPDC023855 TaxID=3154698 RepID=UPI0033FE0D21